jgi:glutamate/tyrosine decarboxylase-like PLP-dependent enzyme
MGPELSRSFRSLKVWFTLKEHGAVKLGQKIADNCEQAQYLVSLLEKYEQIIRIIRPVSLNIVNFRFEPEELNKTDYELIDIFNDELVKDIHTSGIVLPSSTRIQNRIHIRVCIVSHRTIHQDFDIFMDILFNLYRTRIQAFTTEKKLN